MKTKFKYLTLMATAFILGLSSCSNDDDHTGPVSSSTPKSLFLKINSSIPSTYAEGSAQEIAPVTFSTGNLYFTDASGVIKAYFSIGAEESSDLDISTVTTSGTAITNLPGDIAGVYIVGNTSGLPTSGNISTVKAFVRNVETQGDITNVSLYGETTTLTPNDGNEAYYTCTVHLAPRVARFELADIKATGSVITGFDIAGIFVDNYYSQATIDGTVSEDNLQDNGASTTAFNDNSAEYPSALNPSIYDWYTTPLSAVANIAAPSTGAVWGYNVFATTTGSAVPRIIIRLTNITTAAASGITYADDQFITIKGFLKEGTPLSMIKAGEIYGLATGLLNFDETNLTATPNLNTIDVEVKVTLASWVPVTITPEL